jgi:hypothetical protein
VAGGAAEAAGHEVAERGVGVRRGRAEHRDDGKGDGQGVSPRTYRHVFRDRAR